jgi:hypothetical protein
MKYFLTKSLNTFCSQAQIQSPMTSSQIIDKMPVDYVFVTVSSVLPSKSPFRHCCLLIHESFFRFSTSMNTQHSITLPVFMLEVASMI